MCIVLFMSLMSSEVKMRVRWNYWRHPISPAPLKRDLALWFTAKLPKLCTLHASLTSSCLCIQSSNFFLRSQCRKEDVDVRRHWWWRWCWRPATCCFTTESKLLVPVAQHCWFLPLCTEQKHFFQTEKLTTRCQELFPVCFISKPRTSVVAAIASEGNLLLLLCFQLYYNWCSAVNVLNCFLSAVVDFVLLRQSCAALMPCRCSTDCLLQRRERTERESKRDVWAKERERLHC